MLTRFEKRQAESRRLAAVILSDYGMDFEGAKDRILPLCNGQAWLARLVEREMYFITHPKKKKVLTKREVRKQRREQREKRQRFQLAA